MAARKKRKKSLDIREAVSLLYGQGNWHIRGLEKHKIPSFEMHDGPCGLRYVDEGQSEADMSSSRPSICYPAPVNLASSWDEKLVEEVSASIGLECKANKTNMLLAPGVNIKRNPLCGRNFEYFSEDPLLSGKMGASYVRGLQGVGVGACVKHFACNSQESFRMVNDSVIDQRALHEIYLKPFEITIKEADPWAVMTSYNLVNGVYSSDNDYLIRDVLKGDWEYGGVVMSDWGGTNHFIDSHNHGLDLQMPCKEDLSIELLRAVRLGRLSLDAVWDSSSRVMAMLQKAQEPVKTNPFDPIKAHDLATKAAQKSAVLLKNEGKTLPLKDFSSCCVIGELARTPRYQGNGSSKVNPYKLVSFLDTFYTQKGKGKAKLNIPFAPGYNLDDVYDRDDREPFIQAIDLAARHKTVILFLGLTSKSEAEGQDRKNMQLPEEQIRLFDALYEVNQNIIVVLSCGGVVELPFADKTKAILCMHLPGEGGGEAIKALLLGEANPSGKLAESWPKHYAHCPSFGFYPGQVRQSLYRESIYVGYRYYLTAGREVAFPFGYGLSYSKFKYSNISLSKASIKKGDSSILSLDVTNTSSRAGECVVEIYAEPPKGNVFKATRALIAFKKIALKGKETKKAQFEINTSLLEHYDIDKEAFLLEGGKYQIEVGSSCLDIEGKASLKVISEDTFDSKISLLPTYYSPSLRGFLMFDNDFERLLGHPVMTLKDSRSRPYTLNSTFSDIEDTWVGRQIMKFLPKFIDPNSPDAEFAKKMFMEMPIRNVWMVVKPKYAYAIRNAANGRYISALLAMAFNIKNGK